jgi:hypothetical protein
VIASTSRLPAPYQYARNRNINAWGQNMLTNQGTTQVYSPFGSYVVEQHHSAHEQPRRNAEPEPRADKQQSELPKAA